MSIRHRLAASATALVLVVAAVFAVVAYREVRRSAVAVARERVEKVGRQLSDLSAASARQVQDRAKTLAGDTSITRFLRNATPEASRGAMARLAKVGAAGSSRASEIWDREGRRILTTRDTVPPIGPKEAQDLIELATRARATAIGWLAGTAGHLGYAVITPIGTPSSIDGFLVERSRLGSSPQSSSQLRDLIGAGTTLLVGNARGDVWTNFVDIASPPPIRSAGVAAVAEYERPRGHPVIAAITPIPSTPWTIVVETPTARVLAPAHALFRRLALMTVVFLLVGTGGAWAIGATLTRPIAKLVTAAQRMSAGDLTERVQVGRLDELGVLGASFNAMVERISRSHDALEGKVAEVQDAESRHRMLAERLERVIGSSGAILYELRLEESGSVLEWMSHNAATLLGYDLPEVQEPRWWSDNVHPDDRERLGSRPSPDGYRDGSNEFRFRHKDGQYRWLREEQRIIRGIEGQPTRVVGAWLDVTEQRQLEDRLRQTQKMESVGRLAGGVAHDFNNLLTVISGFTGILLQDLTADAESRDSLDEIMKAADRATQLTRQLLAFSRQQVLRPHYVDLNVVIAGAENMLRRLGGDDVVMTMNLGPSLGLVFADPGQVEQVLTNLVVNARDAMPDGGTIIIETHGTELDENFGEVDAPGKPGEYAAIIVSDTGTGMTAEVRERIFDPFYTTKEVGKGTGLGLATVHGIVEQSGGRVFVYSEPGKGTTFKVYFPCTSAAVGEAEEEASAHSESVLSGVESILLVEDDAAVRKVTTSILSNAGYTVIEAADGSEGLRICGDPAVVIDAVLTDMVMPVMDGPDLARGVRARRPGTPMIFMSGYSRTSIAAEALIANASFMEKPFSADALLRTIREALDRAQIPAS